MNMNEFAIAITVLVGFAAILVSVLLHSTPTRADQIIHDCVSNLSDLISICDKSQRDHTKARTDILGQDLK